MGTGGTFSEVHVISNRWLVMIGDFQSRGNFPFVPRHRPRHSRHHTAVVSDEWRVTRQGAGLKPGLYKARRRDGSKNKRPDDALKGGATFKKGAAVLRPYKEIRETVRRRRRPAPDCLDYSAAGNNNSFPSGSTILITS